MLFVKLLVWNVLLVVVLVVVIGFGVVDVIVVWFFFDLLEQMEECVVCLVFVVVKYEILVNIFFVIWEKEGGKLGQWVKNINGIYDVGEL